MTLYEVTLLGHSYLRWVVVSALLLVSISSFVRWLKRAEWSIFDQRVHASMLGVVNLQFLLGLLLYVVLSPLPRAFLADVGAGMKAAPLRFFGMEHLLGMLLGIAAVHIGRTRGRRAASGPLRHRAVWTWTVFGLLLVLVSIPWPSRASGRPLLRGFAGAPTSASARVAPTDACPPTYASRCLSCHGSQGRGDGPAAAALLPKPRNLSDPNFSKYRSDQALRQVIRGGGSELGLSPVMPSHLDLTDDELDALVRCVRAFGESARP